MAWNMNAIERVSKRLNQGNSPADVIDMMKAIIEIAKTVNKIEEKSNNTRDMLRIDHRRLEEVENIMHSLQYRYEFRNIIEQRK